MDVQQSVMCFISRISKVEDYQTIVVEAGAIQLIVPLLSSDDDNMCRIAMATLMHLSNFFRDIIVAAGAVGPLILLLSNLPPHPLFGTLGIVKTLESLSELEVARAEIVAAGGVKSLVGLMGGENDDALSSAATKTLANLAMTAEYRATIVEVGAVEPLVCMLAKPLIALSAVKTLEALSSEFSEEAMTKIVVAGGLGPLMSLMRDENVALSAAAAKTMSNLEKARDRMADQHIASATAAKTMSNLAKARERADQHIGRVIRMVMTASDFESNSIATLMNELERAEARIAELGEDERRGLLGGLVEQITLLVRGL
jgi:hypothetical protein